jgi:5-methylcytosine-specific restriction endonuclease McrA
MGALVKLKRKLFSQRELGLRPPWRVWLTFQKWFIRQEKKKGPLVCHYCGKSPLFKNSKITPPSMLATLDHVYPRAKGGREYDVNNLVVSCRPCNAKKADKLL